MVTKSEHHVDAEVIKSLLFEGLLSSREKGERFHYVRDYGLDSIDAKSPFCDLQPSARTILKLVFRHNLQHTITPRGLRISITPAICRIITTSVGCMQ